MWDNLPQSTSIHPKHTLLSALWAALHSDTATALKNHVTSETHSKMAFICSRAEVVSSILPVSSRLFPPCHLCYFLHYEKGEREIGRVSHGTFVGFISVSRVPHHFTFLFSHFLALLTFAVYFTCVAFPQTSLQLNGFLSILIFPPSPSPLHSLHLTLFPPTLFLFHFVLTPPIPLVVPACLCF